MRCKFCRKILDKNYTTISIKNPLYNRHFYYSYGKTCNDCTDLLKRLIREHKRDKYLIVNMVNFLYLNHETIKFRDNKKLGDKNTS